MDRLPRLCGGGVRRPAAVSSHCDNVIVQNELQRWLRRPALEYAAQSLKDIFESAKDFGYERVS